MLDFQFVLYVLVGFGLLAVLLSGKQRVKVAFIVGTFFLATGYRRVFLTSYLEFHSAELFFWLAVFLMIFESRLLKSSNVKKFSFPRWMIIFMLFWPWGWIISFSSNLPLDLIVNQFKSFLAWPVSAIVAWRVLRVEQGWRTAFTALFGAGAVVGILGVFEYHFPGLAGAIPGFSAYTNVYADALGFYRARFAFYGAPTGTFLLVAAAPLGLALLQWSKTKPQKFFILVGVLVQIYGVYIGGYRSMWLAIGCQIILFLLFNYGLFWGIVALVPFVFLYQSLPNEALLRLATLFSALEGQAVDSSAVKRLDRIEQGWEQLLANPFGTGWGTSGWVHNDLLQIGLDLGVVALLVFIIAYLLLAFRLVLRLMGSRKEPVYSINLSIFLSFVGSGFLYVAQGITWQIFLLFPATLVWAIAEHWLDAQADSEKKEDDDATQDFSAPANLQQRFQRARYARNRFLGR